MFNSTVKLPEDMFVAPPKEEKTWPQNMFFCWRSHQQSNVSHNKKVPEVGPVVLERANRMVKAGRLGCRIQNVPAVR